MRVERELLARLYEKHYKALYLYVYALCRSVSAAEDIVQEAFCRAMLSFPEGHTDFKAWLYVVARNLAYESMRGARPAYLEDETEPPDPGPDIAERLALDERNRALYRALARIPAREREVLTLYYFSGLSHGEIAAALRIKPESARIFACRGKQNLKRILEEEGYEHS